MAIKSGDARSVHLCVALAIAALVTLVAPNAVIAGIGASATPTFPSLVTVGQTGVAASIEVRNQNTPNDGGATNTVCNAGDSLPCPANDPGITLIPSCSQLGTFSECTAAGAEPGVMVLSPTGSGAAGTACAGIMFRIELLTPDAGQPDYGRYRFTPESNQHITLAGVNAVCRIAFTFDVVKSPTKDQDPVAPGTQTVQVVDNTQWNGVLTGSGRGTSSGQTVVRARTAISTVASPTVPIGGTITDTAVVTGRANPVAGATVTFNAYAANDPSCAAAPIFTSVAAINADGTATSGPYTPPLAGSYKWIATYSGDANNEPAVGLCSDAGETVTVTQARPSIVTTASPGVQLNLTVTDSAVVSGRINPIPGATVTFTFYGVADVTCTAGAIFSSTVVITANGTATSAPYAPAAAGTYRWVATYNGDANNAPVSGACGDAGESVTITGPPVSSPPLPPTGVYIGQQLGLAGGFLLTGVLLVRRSRQKLVTQ
jgi:hypothetical protein